MRPQRFQFGTEHQVVRSPAVVEWLLAEAIADQREDAPFAIPQREGEHTDRFCESRLDPQNRDRLKEDFRVRVPAPSAGRDTPLRLQHSAKLTEIVNLAVEIEDIPPVPGLHRLMTGWREVDDRQAAVPQGDPCFGVDT